MNSLLYHSLLDTCDYFPEFPILFNNIIVKLTYIIQKYSHAFCIFPEFFTSTLFWRCNSHLSLMASFCFPSNWFRVAQLTDFFFFFFFEQLECTLGTTSGFWNMNEMKVVLDEPKTQSTYLTCWTRRALTDNWFVWWLMLQRTEGDHLN